MIILKATNSKYDGRAYYQGMVDAVQILAGLGIVKESVKVKELLNTIMK